MLPPGWTAEVWARVPDARIAAWTPQGDLLVSEPSLGKIVMLVPDATSAAPTTVVSGLTNPQGLAFASVGGQPVLYVGESNQITRYRWGTSAVIGPAIVVAPHLPDLDPNGDDNHRSKDVTVAPDGTVYFNVGSASNADQNDRSQTPPRGVIMAVNPDGTGLRVVMTGVRNGEGLAVAPDGGIWTAVNERDQVPDPSGRVISSYVNEHPLDEVVPVTAGRDLGWPYCDPDPDLSGGRYSSVPLRDDSLTDPGGRQEDCSALPPIQVGLAAHSAPLGMSFLEGSAVPGPWSGGAVLAVHGSWDRHPPRPPAVLWMAWDAARHTLEPAVTLVGGFQNPDGSRWGRPADAVAGPDGALYVTDDLAGAVYRIQPLR